MAMGRKRRETNPLGAGVSQPAAPAAPADEDLMMEDDGEMVTEAPTAAEGATTTRVQKSKGNGTETTSAGLNGRQGRRQGERAVSSVGRMQTFKLSYSTGVGFWNYHERTRTTSYLSSVKLPCYTTYHVLGVQGAFPVHRVTRAPLYETYQ